MNDYLFNRIPPRPRLGKIFDEFVFFVTFPLQSEIEVEKKLYFSPAESKLPSRINVVKERNVPITLLTRGAIDMIERIIATEKE